MDYSKLSRDLEECTKRAQRVDALYDRATLLLDLVHADAHGPVYSDLGPLLNQAKECVPRGYVLDMLDRLCASLQRSAREIHDEAKEIIDSFRETLE